MFTGRVLVTGAAGYIGQAVSHRLQAAGIEVGGLVRSDVAAATIRSQGIEPVIGDLDHVDDVAGLDRFDAIIDTATADHAPSTEAFLSLLSGSGKPFIRTSGTGVYTDLAGGAASDRVYREVDAFEPAPVVAARYHSDERVIAAAADGIRTVVIRPSMIYGDGASEQLPLLIRHAITSGESIYVGEGMNRWANVFLSDLAEVYLLALHRAEPGSVYNIASGELEMRQIAQGIATLLGDGPAKSVPIEAAHTALGERWVDVALASNSRVDATRARTELGWNPLGPSLLDDLTRGSYRRVWSYKTDPHDHVSSAAH